MNNTVINGCYKVDKQVGKGSFGEVYIGYDLANKHLIAIKVADNDKRNILRHEYKIYLDLISSPKPPLIPKIHWSGDHEDSTVIVMKYLGNSLESLLSNCAGTFTLKTTLMISLQLFDLLMKLHGCNYIHRDIKPDNFLIGIGSEKSQIYLIDFGLAKRFKSAGKVHIKPAVNKKLTGTARYASINSHKRLELSRRDDLESLGYLMIYFIKGKLPWQGIPACDKEEKYRKIGAMKEGMEIEKLCEGVPVEIYTFLVHVRSLEFKEKPNYHYLRSLLVNAFNRLGYDYDYYYDWEAHYNQAQALSMNTQPQMGAMY